jgi:hypothetical protein
VGPRCQREGERERVKRAGVGYWAGGASRARDLLLVGRGEKRGERSWAGKDGWAELEMGKERGGV